MGNANINLGIIGADWSEDGGGVTLLGVRVGGGKNGAEVGVNTGFGAQVNGAGLLAEAKAQVSIGGKGVTAGAGANYNAAGIEGGAAAVAGANYDGSTYAEAVSNSSTSVLLAKDKVEKAKNDLVHFRQERDKARVILTDKEKAFEEQKTQVLQLQLQHNETEKQKVKAGKEKSDVLGKKTEVEMNLATSKMKLTADTRRLQSSTTKKGGKNVELMQRKVVDLTAEIARLEKDVDELGIIFEKHKRDFDKAEKELFHLASKIVEETRTLDKAKKEKENAKSKKVEADTRVKKEETNVKNHEDVLKQAESKYKRAKADQDLYRNPTRGVQV
jgi:chromosome segregation ATPase